MKASIALLLAFLGVLHASGIVIAQLDADPSTLPIPTVSEPDPARAVVISVMFNSETNVVVQDVTIANVRAKGSVADPPLLMLELLDGNGAVLGEQHAWHPLWATDWDDTGTQEAGQTLASGTGTFYVPLSETLAAVRITDMVLAQELTTADVSTQVGEYCSAHPLSVICGGPGEPTTTSTTTTTVTSTTTSTTLASGGACGDPVGSAGSLTARISTTTINASDALFTLRAGVGSEACELCVCDVDDSGEVNSSDALGILKFGVGQPVVLNCPTCAAGGG